MPILVFIVDFITNLHPYSHCHDPPYFASRSSLPDGELLSPQLMWGSDEFEKGCEKPTGRGKQISRSLFS
jgi:hypothetical protein